MSHRNCEKTAVDLDSDAHKRLNLIVSNALDAACYDAFVFSENDVSTNFDFRERFEQQAKLFRDNPDASRCAIWGNKSLWSYATICAAIAERVTFCIVDPQFPEARREEIVRSFQPSMLVKDENVEIRLVDSELPTERNKNSIAYIMFTSGTTGRPKGVRISYHNLLTFLEGALAEIDLRRGDRWANHANLSFDLSMFDLLGSLKVRATLYPIVEQTDKLFPGRFIERNKITVWHSTPTVVRYMLAEQAGAAGRLNKLRTVLMCGEPLRTEWVHYLLQNCDPICSVYNCYGPTETTVFCTVDKFSDPDDARLANVTAPIGTPITGVEVEYDPVSADEYEIVIRGATVGLGYDNSSQESGRAYGQDEEGLFFRTGDFIELRSGAAYFKRRGDRQVKLRGNRFELEEAEAILNEHNCFDCVFCIQEDSLFLFVGLGCECSDARLREVCRTHLPDFAQPRSIYRIDKWPISMNGKLNMAGLVELIQNGS